MTAETRRFDLFAATALVVITGAVYSPLLGAGFINFDDPPLVTQNPAVQSGVTLEGLSWAFTTGHVANWIPLSWLSHMLDVQLFGMNPAGHHLVSLLFHVANTLLLYLFLRRTTGSPARSAAVAALFAWHPLHVESVAWVAERKDVLSTFFWMLTLCLYSFYAARPGIARYGAVAVSFILGLLAKPMLVTLPVVLLLLDWWPLERFSSGSGPGRTTLSRALLEKLPLLALAACSSVITYLVQAGAGTVSQGYTLLSRLARVVVSYVTYLFMTVWPVDLAVIYPFSRYPPSTAAVAGGITLLIAVTLLAFLLRRRCPPLLAGWGWYLVTLLPVIGLIQIGQHSVADRYTYIPLTGVFVMAAWGIPSLARHLQLPGAPLAGGAAFVAAVLLVLTYRQVSYWKDSFTLFDHAVRVTADNWVALNNLGLEYQARGDLEQALNHFSLSIRAKPSYALAFLNRGVVYRMKNEPGRALEAFASAVMFEPGNQEARLGLALTYLDLGREEEAVAEYRNLQGVGSEYAPGLLREIERHRTGK